MGSRMGEGEQVISDQARRISHRTSLERPNEVPIEDTTCDFTICAPKCFQKCRNIKIILAAICWCAVVQSTTTNGFVSSVITTLEKRYHLTSTESGAIASVYDIGCVLVLLPLSYFGGNWRRLRILAFGMLVISVGCFTFALPQATSGKYFYSAPTKPKCYRNSNVTYDSMCGESKGHLNNYKFVFWFAHLMVGIGASPLHTLATAYIDENLPSDRSALYIGIIQSVSIVGPAIGFILAASMLDIFVDIGSPHPGITPANKEIWVGAWWINFLMTGVLAVVVVIPLYGFPKELPETYLIRAQKKSEAFGNSEITASKYVLTFRDFLRNTMLILTNPTFSFISISGLAEGLLVTGFATFGPKLLETLFDFQPSKATMTFGMVIVPTGGLGMFLGGLVIRLFKMSMKGILKLQFAGAALSIPCLLFLIIECDPEVPLNGVAGISRGYIGNSTVLTSVNLTSSCNVDCKCKIDRSLFLPMCGSNRMTYYSPCYAGCTSYSSSGYGHCSCISSSNFINTTEVIKTGSCRKSCKHVKWFIIMMGVTIFLKFFINTPILASTLRSVPKKQKTFALGIHWIIVRSFGSIPGPMIFGYLIDSACILWNEKCEARGGCAFYNGSTVRKLMIIIAFTLKTISMLALLLAWLSYKETKVEVVSKRSSESFVVRSTPSERNKKATPL